MPPLMFVVAAGLAAYAGYRWYHKQVEQSDSSVRRAEARQAARPTGQTGSGPETTVPGMQAKDLGALEWDEAAGAYRPKRVN